MFILGLILGFIAGVIASGYVVSKWLNGFSVFK